MIRLYILIVCYLPIIDPYLPRTDFGSGVPDIGPLRFFSYLLVVLFLFQAAERSQIKLYTKWIGFIFAYMTIVLASVSWSNYSYTTSLIQTMFDAVVMPLIMAIIGLKLFSKIDNIDKFIKNIILASFILSLMSMYQMFTTGVLGEWNVGYAAGYGKEIRSTAGTLRNPNGLAIFLVLTIPCIIYSIEKQMISKKNGWMLSATLAGGIICTISRKGIATGILAFCIYYILKGHYKKIVAMGFVVMVLTLLLSGYAFLSGRFTQDKLDQNFAGKWAMTSAGWQMYKESPLIGLGWKGYYDRFGKYFPLSDKEKYDAHNIFITALTNYGILGFIPFLGIFLYPLFVAKKALRVKNSAAKELAIVCISSIIPFMLNGWFAGGLFYQQVVVVLLYTNILLFISQDTY